MVLSFTSNVLHSKLYKLLTKHVEPPGALVCTLGCTSSLRAWELVPASTLKYLGKDWGSESLSVTEDTDMENLGVVPEPAGKAPPLSPTLHPYPAMHLSKPWLWLCCLETWLQPMQ